MRVLPKKPSYGSLRTEGFDNGGWVGCDREAWRLRVMLAVFVFLLAVFVFYVLAEWSSLVYQCVVPCATAG